MKDKFLTAEEKRLKQLNEDSHLDNILNIINDTKRQTWCYYQINTYLNTTTISFLKEKGYNVRLSTESDEINVYIISWDLQEEKQKIVTDRYIPIEDRY